MAIVLVVTGLHVPCHEVLQAVFIIYKISPSVFLPSYI